MTPSATANRIDHGTCPPNKALLLTAAVLLVVLPAGADEWETVQDILAGTKDTIVLDGLATAPVRSAVSGEATAGDWLVRHALSDPENLNPYTSSDAGASNVRDYILESLLSADREPPYALKGMLAEAYPTVSENHLEYAFRVREGAHFADGHPLTAADVLFSMKVIQHPEVLAPHLRNYYASVADVLISGEYGVTFFCKEPYFLNDLMLGSFGIIPKHFYDPGGLLDEVPISDLIDGSWKQGPHAQKARDFAQHFNQDFNRAILGSGPYEIADVESDIVTQQKVVLTRNEDYWAGAVAGMSPGFVDKIVFKVINNTDAAFIELSNGNLDLYGLRPLEFKEKSWSDDFQERFLKVVQYGGGYTYVGWNNAHPIFRDRMVRRAMTHLIDRESMVENLVFGLGEPVVGPIHKFRPEYNHDLELHPFDPDHALDLLEQAGWEDADDDGILDKVIDGKRTPFQFEILINSGNQIRKDIALVVQSELQDIGIDCQVRELDWSIFLQRVRSRDFAAMTLGWTGNVRFPPDGYQIWHSSQVESGSNYIGFENDEVDGILERYRQEFDPQRRVALYTRFQEIIHDEQPYTFLWKGRGAMAYSRRYQGVNWYPGGDRSSIGENSLEWWVHPDAQQYR